ncbi:MAG: DUF1049 domain-containing protein [Alphaproteobacteria bacterium]|nr:DUF1049 domain-containing protein [Alphaproteobacteria bacterium]MCW5740677.1 DUF1049 domain-containing protein [Alphaproteobacteria bacterium]
MKTLSRILLGLFLAIGVLVAVSNREPVELALWPLRERLVAPLFILIVFLLLVGVLVGLLMGWFSNRRHRTRARHRGAEVERLEREVARLKGELSTYTARAETVEPPKPADSRALARQQALVDPDSVVPITRAR